MLVTSQLTADSRYRAACFQQTSAADSSGHFTWTTQFCCPCELQSRLGLCRHCSLNRRANMSRTLGKSLSGSFRCKVLVVVLAVVLQLQYVCMLDYDLNKYYLIALKDGDVRDAMLLAKENHCKLVKQVRGFDNVFLLERLPNYNSNSKRSQRTYNESFDTDQRVLWASEQQPIMREKRDLLLLPYIDYFNEVETNHLNYFHRPLAFNDELWGKQWYMQNTPNKTGTKKLDLNVLPVYAKGITGKGVRVAVLDDGLEFDHEDLIDNFDPEISWDCNNDMPDPRPDYTDFSNRHGTRCAGEIAMIANNKKCGVGVAYNARIGGIKLLDNLLFDFIEGMALGFAHDKVDIYSSSWGPTDNGMSLDKPGPFAAMALKRGVNEGRHGKGSIYVWASGNGGSKDDNCNCDGYCTSIYTITIGSVTQRGTLPWYSEKCASIMTVTYSSGTLNDKMIATTDLRNRCTLEHTGTSASAPLAAGIIALGLEANPELTWRDVQHILVRSADKNSLDEEGWQKNGAGRYYNHQFGFGLMNADAFVSLASNWKTVPPKFIEEFIGLHNVQTEQPKTASDPKTAVVLFHVNTTTIRQLEHVEIKVNVVNKVRGKLNMFLISPSGIKVSILEQRKHDNSTSGFKDWIFMSVGTWSEDPRGIWQLQIIDNTKGDSFLAVGRCTLILHGTIIDPETVQNDNNDLQYFNSPEYDNAIS